jgi:putative transcriptional regulator
MSPDHHPAEELLLELAAGQLERGPALVLRAHLQACPACQAARGRFEAVGGALLETLPAAAMQADALEHALARIETPVSQPNATAKIEVDLPTLLQGEALGPRRWLAPGLWLRRLEAERGARFSTYLLHVAPHQRLPRHGHLGAEYCSVLEGAFADETGRYGPGDFACGDEGLEHSPTAQPGDACLCLIASEGRLKMHGLAARALQIYAGV